LKLCSFTKLGRKHGDDKEEGYQEALLDFDLVYAKGLSLQRLHERLTPR
jgi:hypothetical protein